MGIEATSRVPGRGKIARLRERLPIYLADVRAHPGWTVMFAFGRLVLARRLSTVFARRRLARRITAAADGAPGALSDGSVSSVVQALRRDGLCTGLQLPASVAEEIRAFAESHTCYAAMDRRMPFRPDDHDEAERRYGCRILVGHFLDSVLDCPAVNEMLESHWVRAVAAGYLQSPPKNIATRLWWSFPTTDPSPAELSLASQDGFHFDLDDWRQIKFMFYLTDVDAGTGPHVYVRGSHAHRPLSHQFSLFVGKPRAQIVSAYGADAIETLTGPAGSGFAEDSFGYHTGTRVRHGRRLIFELSFGVNDLMRRRRFGEVTPAPG